MVSYRKRFEITGIVILYYLRSYLLSLLYQDITITNSLNEGYIIIKFFFKYPSSAQGKILGYLQGEIAPKARKFWHFWVLPKV